jgi:predicted MFS family arabinose efflux permease
VLDVPAQKSGTGLTRAEWPLLLVLGAIQFTHSMDFMVMLPLGAHCREELGITPQQFSFVAGAYCFAAALGGLLAAFLMDRLDRKTSLLTLYGGLTLGTLLCGVAPSYVWLLVARSVTGLFGGVVAAVILVVIGDAFPEERRGQATGVVMTGFSLACIAGLPIGILFGNRFGVRAPFFYLGFFSIAVWMVAYRVLPRLRGHLDHQQQSASETWTVLLRPTHLRAYTFMLFLVLGSFTISTDLSDYLVHNVGRDKDDLAWIYLCGGAVTFFTMSRVGRLADRFGKRRMFRLMAACTVATILLLTNLPENTTLVALLALTTCYWVSTSGRWVPAMALITSTVLPRYRGGFMSVIGSVQQLACGLASVVAGLVVTEGEGQRLAGYSLAGLIAAAGTGLCMILCGRLRAVEEVAEPAAEEVLELAEHREPAPVLTPAAR